MKSTTYNNLLTLFLNYKGIGYVSIKYRRKDGELSKRLLNVGANYSLACAKDLKTLNDGVEYIQSPYYDILDWNTAIRELKESLTKPNRNRSLGQTQAYAYIPQEKTIGSQSIKYNFNTVNIYLFAMSEKKTVILPTPNVKRPPKSSPVTLAKKVIKSEYLKTSKFRTFILRNVCGTVRVNGNVLEIEVDNKL